MNKEDYVSLECAKLLKERLKIEIQLKNLRKKRLEWIAERKKNIPEWQKNLLPFFSPSYITPYDKEIMKLNEKIRQLKSNRQSRQHQTTEKV